MPIDNAVAYFELQTGLKIPESKYPLARNYAFCAETDPAPDLAVLTVSVSGPEVRFYLEEGTPAGSPLMSRSNPFNVIVEGFIDATKNHVEACLIRNGGKLVNTEINPDSVFANIKRMPFRPRDTDKLGIHLRNDEREPT